MLARARLKVAALVINETGDGAVPLEETVATLRRFVPGARIVTMPRVKAPVAARDDFARLAGVALGHDRSASANLQRRGARNAFRLARSAAPKRARARPRCVQSSGIGMLMNLAKSMPHRSTMSAIEK